MAYQIKITEFAETDIDDAVAYILLDSSQNALQWLSGIEEKILTLQEMPKRCPLAPESEKIGRELRVLLYHKHRIIFDIDEEKEVVRILRVWHSARREVLPPDLL